MTALGPASSTGDLGPRPSWRLILASFRIVGTLSPTSVPTLLGTPNPILQQGPCPSSTILPNRLGGYRRIRWKPALKEPEITV